MAPRKGNDCGIYELCSLPGKLRAQNTVAEDLNVLQRENLMSAVGEVSEEAPAELVIQSWSHLTGCKPVWQQGVFYRWVLDILKQNPLVSHLVPWINSSVILLC